MYTFQNDDLHCYVENNNVKCLRKMMNKSLEVITELETESKKLSYKSKYMLRLGQKCY